MSLRKQIKPLFKKTPSHQNSNFYQNFSPIQLQKTNKTRFQANPISSKSKISVEFSFSRRNKNRVFKKTHLHSSRVEQNQYCVNQKDFGIFYFSLSFTHTHTQTNKKNSFLLIKIRSANHRIMHPSAFSWLKSL